MNTEKLEFLEKKIKIIYTSFPTIAGSGKNGNSSL